MTLNNLELRHNARGISNSKPLEHLEPIQCGRYRAWKLGSDTLKTIHTPRHVDIKSVILHEKLSVCKMIWATKLKMFENIYQQWLLSGLWIAGLWIRKKTRHISANILSDHSFGMWCPNTVLASDMKNNAIHATAISGYTGCLKKLSFAELSISRFVTDIISTSSLLEAGSPKTKFGKTHFLDTLYFLPVIA